MSETAKPRVLLVCDGLLRYASGLAGGLLQAGGATALVTRDHALEFGGDQKEMRQDIERLASPGTELLIVPGRFLDLRALREVASIGQRRRAFRPNVVHLQDGSANDPRLLMIAGLRRGRYAYTVHDPVKHPGDDETPRQARALRSWLIRRAGVIFVHGEALRDEFLESEQSSVPVEVVPIGTAEPSIPPLPESPSILLFGRLSAYKGIDVLLDAMDAVWEQSPEARLIIAGHGQLPSHPQLADPRVDLRFGHVPESQVPALFGESSIVVLPYVQASQSGVGSQAKSSGRPMVVTSVGGLPELVADGSGVVVEPGDPADLATAIVGLIGDREKAARMGAQGARSAATATSWRSVGDATLEIYAAHGLLTRHDTR